MKRRSPRRVRALQHDTAPRGLCLQLCLGIFGSLLGFLLRNPLQATFVLFHATLMNLFHERADAV